MIHQKEYENGLRLLTVASEATKAMTLLILVGAGSRYESDAERGIAHFQEHMFFKGGERYTTPRIISETIDGIGGDFNAFTGKEYTGYYIKLAAEKKELAFDMLSDMLLNSTFPTQEIDKERGVIIEEMNMYEDMPIYKVGWDFEETIFGKDHPMGRDQIGLSENIMSFTQDDFREYKKVLYTPENTVIVASGNITSEESEKLVNQYFQFPEIKKEREKVPFAHDQYKTGKVFLRNKNTEQAHMVIGFPGLTHFDEDKYAESILSIILGGNMSSRMFLNVREEKGLCYSISTSTDRYTDCGTFSTRAGVSIAGVEEAMKAILDEYEIIRKDAPSEEEVQKAKNYLKGKVTLSMEDSEEIASFAGTQSILTGKIKTIEEYFDKIDAVTVEEVHAVAQKLLDPAKRTMAIIGPFADKLDDFQKILDEY